MKIKLGLIGIAGDDFKADFWGILKKVKGIGYQGIEIGRTILENLPSPSLADFKQQFDNLDMKIINCHAGTFYDYND